MGACAEQKVQVLGRPLSYVDSVKVVIVPHIHGLIHYLENKELEN